ncbi:MAG TPA: TIGR03435 family protein [Acidobacteriaceae bacterium]
MRSKSRVDDYRSGCESGRKILRMAQSMIAKVCLAARSSSSPAAAASSSSLTSSSKSSFCAKRRIPVFVFCIAALLGLETAKAQTAAVPSSPAKTLAFDVVSIRPSKPAGAGAKWGIQPDGYSTHNQTMWSTIMIAYFPQGMANWTPDRLKGAPSWLNSDQYDISAKVAAVDLPEWQRQGSTLDREDIFRAMLQSMLAERCKLAVHRIPAEVPGFALGVGKRVPQFKPTPPDETVPSGGMTFPEGGTAINQDQGHTIRFYAVSMERLVQYLALFSYPRYPIQDQTGLTGKYDLVLHRLDDDPSGRESSGSSFDVESIGLQLKPIKVPTETLVIDYIERPSAN